MILFTHRQYLAQTALLILLGILFAGCGGVIAGGERSGSQEDNSGEDEGGDDGFTKSVESVPIAGINLASVDNAEPDCHVAEDKKSFLCQITVDIGDISVTADNFAQNTEAEWSQTLVSGTAEENCEIQMNGLNYFCEYASVDKTKEALVRVDMTISSGQKSRTESKSLTLFFDLFVSAGLVPNVARNYIPGEGPTKVVTDESKSSTKNALGQVATAFSTAMEFHSATAACGDFLAKNKRAFFSWNKYVFEYLNKNSENRRFLNWDGTDNMIAHFAGSTKTGATSDLSNRVRTALGSVQFDIHCGDDHVLVPDFSNNRILKFTDTGAVKVLNDTIPGPLDLQYDPDGNLFVLSSNKGIWMIDRQGAVSLYVDASVLHFPYAFYRKDSGNFLIADFFGHRVIEVGPSATDLVAGDCSGGPHNANDGDPVCTMGGQPASGAVADVTPVSYPTGVTVDRNGTVFISLFYRGLYYLNSGNIYPVAGEESTWDYDTAPKSTAAYMTGTPISADLSKHAPYNFVSRDKQGFIIFDTATGLSHLDTSWNKTVLVGPGGGDELADGCSGDVPGIEKRFTYVGAMDYDANGDLILLDRLGFGSAKFDSIGIYQVKESGRSSIVKNLHGCAKSNEMKVTADEVNSPGLAVLSNGNYVFANPEKHVVIMVDATGTETILAGSVGAAGDVDGATATSRLDTPSDIAVDASDNVYVADYGNNKIKVISGIGAAVNVASLPVLSGSLGTPEALDVSGDGSLIVIGDAGDNRIRLWKDADDSVVIIGGSGVATYSSIDHAAEENGAATSANIVRPRSVRFSRNVNTNSEDVVFVQFDSRDSGTTADDTAIVRKLVNDGSGSYTVKTLFGGGSNKDCGSGRVKAKTGDYNAAREEICNLRITSVAVNDAECRADANGNRRIDFANSSAETTHVVGLKIPCKVD